MIMDFLECDAVELWLRDHEKYFRCKATRGPERSLSFEIAPCLQNENGDMIPWAEDDPNLFYLCREIILGHAELSQPGFTKNGSFWTGNTKKLPFLTSKSNRKFYLHHSNIGGGYLSLGVIPLRVDHQNIGLLQLKSQRRNFFKGNQIEFFEDVAQILGIALSHRHVQVDLRERIKERTCLYGIARLAAQFDKSMEEILQDIAEILPSAWLYPEIACSRIVLDGRSYSTSPFGEGRHQQRSEITVKGELRGWVEVIYVEERPELDEGAFLREERNLLDAVAREVAIIITRREDEQEKSKLENQLRHADRLATIGQLAAGVAHELNEPLGNILGFAQLAKKCPELPKQAEQDIEKILSSSLYAREIVKKLLIFARQMPSRKAKVNLNQLIQEGFDFFESRCAKEGIELLCSLSPELPEMEADPAQLNQVFINLVVNALQAMPKGGVLKIQTLHQNDHIFLIIEDSGIGMSEEVLKKIFTPFFTTKEGGQGTGLGLSVVHGIVTGHGGSIKVESEVGRGTRCEIQLLVKQNLL